MCSANVGWRVSFLGFLSGEGDPDRSPGYWPKHAPGANVPRQPPSVDSRPPSPVATLETAKTEGSFFLLLLRTPSILIESRCSGTPVYGRDAAPTCDVRGNRQASGVSPEGSRVLAGGGGGGFSIDRTINQLL